MASRRLKSRTELKTDIKLVQKMDKLKAILSSRTSPHAVSTMITEYVMSNKEIRKFIIDSIKEDIQKLKQQLRNRDIDTD